jgi:hypothetical protein
MLGKPSALDARGRWAGRPPHRFERPSGWSGWTSNIASRMVSAHNRLVPRQPPRGAEGLCRPSRRPRPSDADRPRGIPPSAMRLRPRCASARPLISDGSPASATWCRANTEAVRRVARESGAASIAPGTDWPVRIAAYVAETRGLRTLDVATRLLHSTRSRGARRRPRAPAGVVDRRARPVSVRVASDRQGQRAMTTSLAERLERASRLAGRARGGGRCSRPRARPGVDGERVPAGGRFHPVAVTASRSFRRRPGVARRHVSQRPDDGAAISCRGAVAALGIRKAPATSS